MILVRTITVALVGNPNTGKTTLFNALAGMRQRVGNYPGVTVETKKGRMTWQDQSFDLVDLPGTYSLAPRSPDEMVAVDLILGHQDSEPRPDVVLSIVDASNLERNLYLTTQLLELGAPVVLALNMTDVAQGQGITIDAEKLAQQLGIRVVPIQANKGKGLDELKQAVADAATGTLEAPERPGDGASNGNADGQPRVAFPEAFEREVEALRSAVGNGFEPFILRRLLLDVGGYIETRLESRQPQLEQQVKQARARLTAAGCPIPAVEARTRYAWIRSATAGCIQRPAKRPITTTDRLDRVLTHWCWGTLVFFALMFLVFQSIYSWAGPLMDLINAGKDGLAATLSATLPKVGIQPGPLTSLLVDGIVKGVGAVVVFLPQIVILFFFIALLEDCGYMARAAYLMDKLMARCGLSGKSFIPMLSSVACAIPGIMATRVIENRRDRLATILVAPLMSCSARLPVYILMIGAFLPGDVYGWWVPGVVMFAMYMIGIVLAPLIALLLKRTLLRGETPVFVMEMPLYKLPSVRVVLRRTYDAGWAFIVRAGTLIFASMVVVWALLYYPYVDENGVSYEDRIAQENKNVAEERKELAELQESIAEDTKQLAEFSDTLATLEQVQVDPFPSPTWWESIRSWLPGLASPVETQYQRWVELVTTRRAGEAIAAKIKPVQDKIALLEEKTDPVDKEINRLKAEWKSRSLLGRLGHVIEPAVEPLGWDWRIGTAALASFPAREVVVGTLGIIYDVGEVDTGAIKEAKKPGETPLGVALKNATWPAGSAREGQKVFTVATALSLMVFFALCCQCASTLAVIRRETRSWSWPVFTFVYMTVLAYVGALIVYQVGTRFMS